MGTDPSRSSAAPLSTLATPPKVLDVSVVIVNYNVREFLDQALRSLERAKKGLRVEVFVVDNDSVDDSLEMVRTCYPDVHVIANQENVGFGTANNQAIRQAKGRYLFILNPDTIVQEDTLETFVQFMDTHPEAGAVGCMILNPDGTFARESRRSFPSPEVAFYRVSGLSRLFPKSRRFGRYNLSYVPKDQVAEVDALSGSCMFVRRSALYHTYDQAQALETDGLDADQRVADGQATPENGAGFFDEVFFMYGEDLDWCFRIQKAGWKIYYTPETQIIHYKGESTKKGELRYVRLFYGAMLLFIEKHFDGRYSRLFAGVLKLGIVARASAMVLASFVRRARPVLIDAGITYGLVTAAGVVRSAAIGSSLLPLFYVSVPLLFALATVLGIATAGGYRWRKRHDAMPVLTGTLLGVILVATASFFFKDIAFSRVIVLLSFGFTTATLSSLRVIRRFRAHRQDEHMHEAVLIGHPREARRLEKLLSSLPLAPFTLVGYIEPKPKRTSKADLTSLPVLGQLRHVRDVIRLRKIDDVVFAANDVPNYIIMRLIQELHDLPVHFRILGEGRTHIIGKASIENLDTPSLLEAEQALKGWRTRADRRAFEIPVALLGLMLHPLLVLCSKLFGSTSFAGKLTQRTQQLPQVLRGTLSLIGYHPGEAHPPPAKWGVQPGIFAISESLSNTQNSRQGIRQAYAFYVRNASATLDWGILMRTIRNL